MDEYKNSGELRRQRRAERISNRGNGKKWLGIFILIVGVVSLLKAMMLPLPGWIFSWQMILIAVGVFLGMRNNFRDGSGVILIIIGGIFLLRDFVPGLIEGRFLWPLALIAVGAFFVLRPKSKYTQSLYDAKKNNTNESGSDSETIYADDIIDSTSVFGSNKKNVISKNFRGGDIVNIFGGSEINLSQADIKGVARLEIVQIFGGTKIYLPADWDVKSEMTAIFAGIDDKRRIGHVITNPDKVLVIEGTSIFGGIEIRTF